MLASLGHVLPPCTYDDCPGFTNQETNQYSRTLTAAALPQSATKGVVLATDSKCQDLLGQVVLDQQISSKLINQPLSRDMHLGAKNMVVPAQKDGPMSSGSWDDVVECALVDESSHLLDWNVYAFRTAFEAPKKVQNMTAGFVPIGVHPESASTMDAVISSDGAVDALLGTNVTGVEIVQEKALNILRQSHLDIELNVTSDTNRYGFEIVTQCTIQPQSHLELSLNMRSVRKKELQRTIIAPTTAAISKLVKSKRRKPRTNSNAAPSLHCHICSRRPSKESPHVVCGNHAEGTCRKSTCEKCFYLFNSDQATGRAGAAENWKCSHCRKECPKRAQCFIYDKTTDRRRQKKVNNRKRKIDVPQELTAPGFDRSCEQEPAPKRRLIAEEGNECYTSIHVGDMSSIPSTLGDGWTLPFHGL